jgi:cyclopropane fatty-acyl-phospholipid synthase-like methyltransferase
MNPFRYRAITHSDHHIMNPLSSQKLARIVDYLRLQEGERVIDVGCGKGSLLRAIAQTHRVEIVGLELNPAFADAARVALGEQALVGAVRIVEGPALDFDVAPGSLDVAACIGATFALGGFEPSLDWLAQAVRSGGRIAIGEPFARRDVSLEVRQRWPEYQRCLADIGNALEARGLILTGLVASSESDWDHYEGQQWRAAAAWLREHPDDPDAPWLTETIAAGRAAYLSEERDCFGWAVLIAEKP